MNKYPFRPYSPSRLDAFERCPRRAYLAYKGEIDRGGGDAADVGSVLHDLAERLQTIMSIDPDFDVYTEVEKYKQVLVDKSITSMFRRYDLCAENLIQWIKDNSKWVLDANTSTEIKIGVNELGIIDDYDKCNYLRGIIDVLYADNKKAIICDYKSGGRVGLSAQKLVYPYFALCMGYEEVEMRFIYLGDEEPDPPEQRIIFGQYDRAVLKRQIETKIAVIEGRPDDEKAFLPSPNEWCEYFNCRFICPFQAQMISDGMSGEDLVRNYYYHQTKYKTVFDIIKALISTEGSLDTERGKFGKYIQNQLQYPLDEVIAEISQKVDPKDLMKVLSGSKIGKTEFAKISKKIGSELLVTPKEKGVTKYGFLKE